MRRYKIIFSGIILPGYDIEQVKSDIQKILKLSDSQAIAFFSGKPITIKNDLPFEQAHSIKTALETKGLLINIEEYHYSPELQVTAPHHNKTRRLFHKKDPSLPNNALLKIQIITNVMCILVKKKHRLSLTFHLKGVMGA
jgi:hypothetical protein